MARRRRKSRGLGAVAKHGSSYTKRDLGHGFHVHVGIARDRGASTKNQYGATACVVARGLKRANGYHRRCSASTRGRTPTAAAKKALRSLASNLR